MDSSLFLLGAATLVLCALASSLAPSVTLTSSGRRSRAGAKRRTSCRTEDISADLRALRHARMHRAAE